MDAKNPQALSAATLAHFTGTARYCRATRQLMGIQLRFAIFLTVEVGMQRRCIGVMKALLHGGSSAYSIYYVKSASRADAVLTHFTSGGEK